MTQPAPTPVPDHGTGWGLLALLVGLYGVVGLLGLGTMAALALHRFDRRVPKLLQYLAVAVLFGALGLAGFTALAAASARRFDVVALLLLVVFLPLAYVVVRRRGTGHGRVAVLSRAAMAWSLPFLVGFGLIAFVGARGGPVPPVAAGVLAVVVVVAGTTGVERLPFLPAVEPPRT